MVRRRLPSLPLFWLFPGYEHANIVTGFAQAVSQALEVGDGDNHSAIGFGDARHLLHGLGGVGEVVESAFADNPVEGSCLKGQVLAYSLHQSNLFTAVSDPLLA